MTPKRSSIFSRARPCVAAWSVIISERCAFQRGTYLGLGDKEPDEEEHGQTEASKSNKCTVSALAHGHQHIRNRPGNDEVEEPLGCGSKSNIQATEACSGDLGNVDPANLQDVSAYAAFCAKWTKATYWTPAPLEERGEKVDADKSEVSGRNHGLIRLRRCDAYEETHVEHRQAHGDRCPEKRPAAPERVGCEDEEKTTHDHLDDTVNARGEETDCSATEAQVVEDLRGICDMLVFLSLSSTGEKALEIHTVVTIDMLADVHLRFVRWVTYIAFVPVIC